MKSKEASGQNVAAQGIPSQYTNAFEWARDWAASNGMTLPPDTSEYRSLRNWYCYKYNQFKKNKLGDANEALLAHYGLDFNQYEANQTGSGERLSDITHTQALLRFKQQWGTYNLHSNAPESLIAWQASIIRRFAEGGQTRRMADIQRRLPDLHFGTWLAPGEPPLTTKEIHWWKGADTYEALAKLYPAIDGEQHPDMPQVQRNWGESQQRLLQKGLLTQKAKGWMRGVGLLPNPASARSELRIAAKTSKAQKDAKLHQYGVADYRLTTIRGAIAFIEAIQENRSAKATMVRFKILPKEFAVLKALVKEGGVQWTQKGILPARLIALNDREAFTPQWTQRLESQPLERPSLYNREAHSLGTLAYALSRQYIDLRANPKILRTADSQIDVAPPQDGQLLFKHYAQAYLEHVTSTASAQTTKGFRSLARKWLIPALGDLSIQDMEIHTLNDFIEKLEYESAGPNGTLSQRTVGNIRNLLITMVNFGRSQSNLPPIASTDLMQGRGYKRAVLVDPFTKSEAMNMLSMVREDYANVLLAIMYSGLTVGRILRIQRSQVDPACTALHLDSDGKLSNYPVDPKMQPSLIAQLRLESGSSGAVYTGRTGSPIDLPNLRIRVLDPLQEHAGVRPRDLKQFRHTAIMFWISEGRTMDWIRAHTGLQIKTLMRDFVPYLSEFLRPSPQLAAQRMPKPVLRGKHSEAGV